MNGLSAEVFVGSGSNSRQKGEEDRGGTHVGQSEGDKKQSKRSASPFVADDIIYIRYLSSAADVPKSYGRNVAGAIQLITYGRAGCLHA